MNIQEQCDKNETGEALKGFMITNKGECGGVGILEIPECHRIPDSLEVVLIQWVLERSAANFLLYLCHLTDWGEEVPFALELKKSRHSSLLSGDRIFTTFQRTTSRNGLSTQPNLFLCHASLRNNVRVLADAC